MKSTNATRFTLGLLALAISGAVAATPNFPPEKTKPVTCADFGWHADMQREHPRVIDTCQEVVHAEGTNWARIEARFVEVQPAGMVVFSVRDQHDREIEKVTVEPAPGQVAYIDDKPTPFNKLLATDTINLYVAEGDYCYSTRPGIVTERFTRSVPYDATASVTTEVDTIESETTTTTSGEYDAEAADQVAMNNDPEPMPTSLPDTAGALPWTALAGSLLLFAAFTLRLARKR